jgi:serine/threonine-protein kinase
MPIMKPDRWNQVDRLLDAALELSPEKRAAFLDEACVGDEELRKELDALLASDDGAQSFLEEPALEVAAKALVDNKDSISGQIIGHYKIISRIGTGGMGEVYLAQDTKLDRRVAIKFLPESLVADEQARKRLVREAQAAAKLDHPNICSVYEVGEEDGRSFIVMQYVEGETLDVRRKREPFDVSESIALAAQVADALAEAHAHAIIHRDIKPSNIIITPRGQAKVLDFGLAKLSEPTALVSGLNIDTEASTQALLTTPGTIIGTVPYMSPEQVHGQRLDARTDIFSFGVVLYELLTGHQPFAAESGAGTISAILTHEPPPLTSHTRDVPIELERIVSKSLRKNRDARYQTMRDLQIDLKHLKEELDFERKRERSAPAKSNSEVRGIAEGHPAVESTAHPATTDRWWTRAFSANRRSIALAGLLLIALTTAAYFYFSRTPNRTINSIAVLPFANLSKDANAEYLSDGITDSLINSLSQLPNVRMIAHGSVSRYKGNEIDPQEVGRALNVQAIVMGRITQLGDNLSISAELVDVGTNSRLWGEQYNPKPTDILKVQAEIAREISDRLRLELTNEQQNRLTKRYTDNADAYLLYTKGRYFWDKRTAAGMEKAREAFNQAIELDPSYALAYSGLADTYLFCYCQLPRHETQPKAKAYAEKALAIDDSLAEAHASLGFVKMNYEFDWVGAEKELKRAIELNPNYAVAHQFYGGCLLQQGRTEEGLREAKRALELDPLSLALNWYWGLTLINARQYDEAISQLRKTIQMDPNYHLAHSALGGAYLQKGMYPDALAEFQTANNLRGSGDSVAGMAKVHRALGNKVEAQKILNELKQTADKGETDPLQIARVYNALGDKDQAIEWLEKAYERRAFGMFFLKVDADFDNLRSDPRFTELLRRMNLAP